MLVKCIYKLLQWKIDIQRTLSLCTGVIFLYKISRCQFDIMESFVEIVCHPQISLLAVLSND